MKKKILLPLRYLLVAMLATVATLAAIGYPGYASGTKLEHLGESRSFRARTARLQSRLSAALRRGMAEGPAGVLAAMVTGDRTHLSTRLRNAYRGAGLSHVLVVSGMLCFGPGWRCCWWE